MKYIKLTDNKIAKIDDDDFELVSKYKWCLSYKKAKRLYAISKIGGKNVRMHRLIINAPRNLLVDHINFNTLDNRKENLRLCNPTENARHSRTLIKTKSGFKGVVYERGLRKKPWRVRIRFNGTYTTIGYYKKKELAAKAYNKAAKAYFGKFASLNVLK